MIELPQQGIGHGKGSAWWHPGPPDPLPAPLERPGRRNLHDPDWFAGSWEVQASDGSRYQVRFIRDGRGRVLGRRTESLAGGCFWPMS
ncbi:MAG: hypothetical protein EA413_12625 [Cyanobium sp. PLM2.Bin73]|nr:MAG: hypothetical protein EA413_12625 [Cyanobium sp. PLM2.Bin73]